MAFQLTGQGAAGGVMRRCERDVKERELFVIPFLLEVRGTREPLLHNGDG